MRLFLAVPLTEAIRASLVEVIARLRECGADVRWVEPENLHLTVAFLGDKAETLLPEIEKVSEDASAGNAPFRIAMRGLSAFPRRGTALKTLYAGLAEGAPEWTALARRAEAAFAPLGIPPSNDLVPHLTLGRVKGEKNINNLRAALQQESETEFGSQNVDHIVLIESQLNPAGATYRSVRTCPFAAPETE